MLLGKKYTRIKRKMNAATIEVRFTRSDGTEIKLPRKLNMLAVLSLSQRVSNKAAVERETNKFVKRLKEESERKINKEVEEMINEYQKK